MSNIHIHTHAWLQAGFGIIRLYSSSGEREREGERGGNGERERVRDSERERETGRKMVRGSDKGRRKDSFQCNG